ncbi:DUF2244 domain-containing protein [Chelativorans intermedius]|uniref:DUF2244 domain-containing protein n=1 Tax=Chelativorans intermedius TaxID=515947 RepID=A0ABV6DCJ5_9HYPH|nr:DUF2244 domain-containing protein [Chelativorans intermedius]MCT8999078.1 DUF2244 domain-containing protein [Chelativorans intermedius]
MQEKNAADQPFFKALLVPHRSMGQRGFAILMAALLLVWLTFGAMFLSIGAWPVFGFFGLDVVAIYIAFRINYRAARAREEVSLSRLSLDIRKVPPSGRAEEYSFNPFWTRFRVDRHTEIGITGMMVEMRERRVSLGSFLSPEERESFARAFGQALATAKGR